MLITGDNDTVTFNRPTSVFQFIGGTGNDATLTKASQIYSFFHFGSITVATTITGFNGSDVLQLVGGTQITNVQYVAGTGGNPGALTTLNGITTVATLALAGDDAAKPWVLALRGPTPGSIRFDGSRRGHADADRGRMPLRSGGGVAWLASSARRVNSRHLDTTVPWWQRAS